jgi:hypothetical protein
VTNRQLRRVLKEVDIDAHNLRCDRNATNFTRSIFISPGVNWCWHLDAWLKLAMYGIYVKGIIDGFSKFVLSAVAYGSNNGTNSAKSLYEVLEREGVPSHIRLDCGSENRKMAVMMLILLEGIERDPFFVGTSTRNTPIERWWRDARRFCLQLYKGMFQEFESASRAYGNAGAVYLEQLNTNHIYILHYLFLGRINESLKNFVVQWNHHSLKLPAQYHHLNDSGVTVKSWVPQRVYRTYNKNFIYPTDLLDRVRNSEEHCTYLFNSHGEDDGAEVDVTLWTYPEQLLAIVHDRFEPLTLDDSVDECKHRYRAAIDLVDQWFLHQGN